MGAILLCCSEKSWNVFYYYLDRLLGCSKATSSKKTLCINCLIIRPTLEWPLLTLKQFFCLALIVFILMYPFILEQHILSSSSFTTAYPHPPSSITAYQHLPSSTTAYHHLPSSTTAYHYLSQSTIAYHKLSSSNTIYNHPPSSITG